MAQEHLTSFRASPPRALRVVFALALLCCVSSVGCTGPGLDPPGENASVGGGRSGATGDPVLGAGGSGTGGAGTQSTGEDDGSSGAAGDNFGNAGGSGSGGQFNGGSGGATSGLGSADAGLPPALCTPPDAGLDADVTAASVTDAALPDCDPDASVSP
jgi:hypothetical protein